MLLAELEIHHSRPIAPTRRVALGARFLPFEPSPGHGGVLLGGIAARFVGELDPDDLPELELIMRELESGRRVAQPRLRYRLQVDRVGLLRSRHRLVRNGNRVVFDLDAGKGTPAQYILGAVYAAGQAPPPARHGVLDAVRRGLRWRGDHGPALVSHLLSGRMSRLTSSDPVGWALDTLGFGVDANPERNAVVARYRHLLRGAHPDLGGAEDVAADRISDLAEARRILFEQEA